MILPGKHKITASSKLFACTFKIGSWRAANARELPHSGSWITDGRILNLLANTAMHDELGGGSFFRKGDRSRTRDDIRSVRLNES